MQINEQTKISALLKHHADALEAIVSLSPDFKKLRNPILRKLMAGRTSIAMAAKVGKCSVDDFFRVLQPLGFEVTPTTANTKVQTDAGVSSTLPDFLKNIDQNSIQVFDVRELLASGTDPLKAIQQKVKQLRSGEVLNIINTFKPVPLISLLAKQGFQAYVKQDGDDYFETYFFKTATSTPSISTEKPQEAMDWEQLLKQFEQKLVHLDVRHLEMPMPMMTILESLDKLAVDEALYVHHKRIPVFLLTELKDRQFDYRIKEQGEGDVYLLIFKNKI